MRFHPPPSSEIQFLATRRSRYPQRSTDRSTRPIRQCSTRLWADNSRSPLHHTGSQQTEIASEGCRTHKRKGSCLLDPLTGLVFLQSKHISARFEAGAVPIEFSPSGQISRAQFVGYEHKITSVPIQSGTAEKMTSLLLKLAALLGGGPPARSLDRGRR